MESVCRAVKFKCFCILLVGQWIEGNLKASLIIFVVLVVTVWGRPFVVFSMTLHKPASIKKCFSKFCEEAHDWPDLSLIQHLSNNIQNYWWQSLIHLDVHGSGMFRKMFNNAGTLGQPLAVWSVWGDLDKVGNKYVWCIQLRWKLLEPRGQCLLRFSAKSEEVGCRPSEPLDSPIGCVLAVWPFWLAVCWRISAVCGRGGILCALCFSLHSVPSFPVFMFWITGTRLVPPDVKETYCISRKRRTYTLFSWQWSKRCVQWNFSAEQVRREAAEWSDKGSWPLVWVWAVCGGL